MALPFVFCGLFSGSDTWNPQAHFSKVCIKHSIFYKSSYLKKLLCKYNIWKKSTGPPAHDTYRSCSMKLYAPCTSGLSDPALLLYAVFMAELLWFSASFHFALMPVTVDCGIYRRAKISQMDLFKWWPPITIPWLIELFRMTHSVTHVWRHRLNFIPLCQWDWKQVA